MQCVKRKWSNFWVEENKKDVSNEGIAVDLYTEEKYKENWATMTLPLFAVLSSKKTKLGISWELVL